MRLLTVFLAFVVSGCCVNGAHAQNVATLAPVEPSSHCAMCDDYDAIVFVHGIYGAGDTFTNPLTRFNWPEQFPKFVHGRPLDVYVLHYQTEMLAWAKGSNPDFLTVAKAVDHELKPLRVRQYRSIGFIAHSLGGNVVSTYIHMVNNSLGHPQRAQNAYVITLGTPVLGAQIADIATILKSILRMSDPLLRSLEANNLYLTMLQEFRMEEGLKGDRNGCRPVHLHAAYEEKMVSLVKVVPEFSGVTSVKQFVASPVKGFPVDHLGLSRPTGPSDLINKWVIERLDDEFARLSNWDMVALNVPWQNRLCLSIPLIPETLN